MLQEFIHVRQEAKGRRRWFETSGFELIVWYTESGEIEGFQLCYEREGRQWALTWRPRAGFHHDLVHTGDTTPFKNQTPTLEPHGSAPWEELRERFAAESGSLEPALRDWVAGRLAERK